MKIKVFPTIGDAYIVELPAWVAHAYIVDAAIDSWIDVNLRQVDSWEYV